MHAPHPISKAVLVVICTVSATQIAIAEDGRGPGLPRAAPIAPTEAAKRVVKKVESILPGGWSARADGSRVMVERTEPVLYHNGVNNPPGGSGNFPATYRITLTLGKRVTPEEYRRRKAANAEATRKTDIDFPHGSKDDLDAYAAAHYGFIPLPWLDTGQESIYVERNISGFAQLVSKQVEAECDRVNDAIANRYHRYEAK